MLGLDKGRYSVTCPYFNMMVNLTEFIVRLNGIATYIPYTWAVIGCGTWTTSHITSHNCHYPLENRDFAVSVEEAAKAGKF